MYMYTTLNHSFYNINYDSSWPNIAVALWDPELHPFVLDEIERSGIDNFQPKIMAFLWLLWNFYRWDQVLDGGGVPILYYR